MLEDSAVDIVLSQSHLSDRLPMEPPRLIYLDTGCDSGGNENVFATESNDNIARGDIHTL